MVLFFEDWWYQLPRMKQCSYKRMSKRERAVRGNANIISYQLCVLLFSRYARNNSGTLLLLVVCWCRRSMLPP